MLGPLVILAFLSITGGWIGIGENLGRFGAFLAPATGSHTVEAGSANLEYILSGVAVAVALLGWYIAHSFYKQKPERPAELAAAFPAGHSLLANKFYVDEFYNATVVKPLMLTSTYILGWVVDKAILGGGAWLLGGIATFCGALLQRWQSGNIRSYAAWLTAGAAAVLLFVLVPWASVLANLGIHLNMVGR
jgi:NADH-quinone oxidoreductase subunit L